MVSTRGFGENWKLEQPVVFALKILEEIKECDYLSFDSVSEIRMAWENNAGTKEWDVVNDTFEAAFPLVCPKEGSFIGYKKGIKIFLKDELYSDNNVETTFEYEELLITLDIPAEAKRSSSFGRKCRCSEAKVLDIVGLASGKHYKSARAARDFGFVYITGITVLPDSFDENRWNECSHGIHFFMTEEEAINYNFS